MEKAEGGIVHIHGVEVKAEAARLFGPEELHWGALICETELPANNNQDKVILPRRTFLFVIDDVDVSLKSTKSKTESDTIGTNE